MKSIYLMSLFVLLMTLSAKVEAWVSTLPKKHVKTKDKQD